MHTYRFIYAFLFITSTVIAAADGQDFDEEDRQAAQVFIEESFSMLRQTLTDQMKDARIQRDQEAFDRARAHKKSLDHPERYITHWDVEHEQNACLLRSYMMSTEAWTLYKRDPDNLAKYEQVHKEMSGMAGFLIDGRRVGHKGVVHGNHHYLQDADDPSFDLDKVYMLTLFLLQSEMDKQRQTKKRKRDANEKSCLAPCKKGRTE